MKKATLLTALFLMAASGLMLHLHIHYFMAADKLHPGSVIFDSTDFMAALFPFLDLFLVTPLFLSRRTAVYGYLFNGMLVIYGTILMAHYSIAGITAQSLPWSALLFKSTLPDIGFAWADFFVGKALYDLYVRGDV